MSEDINPAAAEQNTPAAAPQDKPAEQKGKSASKKPVDEAKPQAVTENVENSDAEEVDSGKPKAPTAADLLKDDIGDLKIRRAKGSKNVYSGIVTVLATFNNTKVSFTDRSGNVISWSSAGKCNFRGSRKSTAYAAQVVTTDAGKVALSHGMKEVEVRLKGPGMGRDSAVRALQSLGMSVTAIKDVTPVPHNGCRSPKRRRV